MSHFSRAICGLCNAETSHSREHDDLPWVCIHHSPAVIDEWEAKRARVRQDLAGCHDFQLQELGKDIADMLDYRAKRLEALHRERIFLRGVA